MGDESHRRVLAAEGHGFTIRPVRPDEVSAILEVYRQCEDFLALGPVAVASEAMVLADLELSRQSGGVYCGIYEAQPDGLGRMIGVLDVVLGGANGRREHADLALLMIAAPHRARGLGREVVATVEEAIRRDPAVTAILSGVQVNNPRAIRFWTRNGYRITSGPELMPDQTTVYHLRKELYGEDDMMAAQRIGVLHPGAMGVSIAASALAGGQEVYWASEGRSAATRERAEKHGLRDAGTVAELCRTCTIIFSICPPHAAEDVAGQVAACGFGGLYLDANAVAPQRAARIGRMLEEAGIAFVDGGIIGGPAWEAGKTWLYLAGPRAEEIAACFRGAPLQAVVLGAEAGAASALKMCYAAYTKGSTALLAAILGAAERLGVRDALRDQWAKDDPQMPDQVSRRVRGSAAKAWRFVGEMEEIAATLSEAGMPGEFHDGAAQVYRRLARFKDAQPAPALEEIVSALLKH